jgi:hypothetical protein
VQPGLGNPSGCLAWWGNSCGWPATSCSDRRRVTVASGHGCSQESLRKRGLGTAAAREGPMAGTKLGTPTAWLVWLRHGRSTEQGGGTGKTEEEEGDACAHLKLARPALAGKGRGEGAFHGRHSGLWVKGGLLRRCRKGPTHSRSRACTGRSGRRGNAECGVDGAA